MTRNPATIITMLSLPARERGSKLFGNFQSYVIRDVAPRAGARIETTQKPS